ncbi:MAG: helix-turn-helix domain-containing protein [Clostridiales bacterium]|nr:helix-turn-helix domain-containing protein [Clostridiales bacterium]
MCLTQSTASTKLGISLRCYQMYESGNNSRLPKYHNLMKIARYINLRIEETFI